MTDRFVLDTNVLSSLQSVGWLSGVAVWRPACDLFAPRDVWREFTAVRTVEQPSWLTLRSVSLDGATAEYPGALSETDWRCLLLSERTDATLVTNDRAMHDAAQKRELSHRWGTAFVLETFDECGLTRAELDRGLEAYSDDLGLPERVVTELRDAEK